MPKRSRLKKLGNIGLAALALVTAAAVAFALVPDRTPAPVSAEVSRYNQENSTPKPLPTRPRSIASADDVRALLASDKPLVISVLGDSTGNGGGEWVDLWAQHLADRATVILHMWDESAQAWRPEPLTYGTGARTIEIWNGSHPGSAVDYGLERIDALQPAKPDLVLANYGHNQGKTPIALGLFELSQKTAAKWGAQVPLVVTVQNPAQGERKAISAAAQASILDWATDGGYPVINAAEAFAAQPDLAALMSDSLHPNWAGSRIWADKVIATIG